MNKKKYPIEDSLYRLINISPIPTILSFPDGRLEYVNPALKNMLGYQGDAIYANDIVITHEADVEVNKLIRSKLNEDPFTPLQVDKRYRHSNGHTVYAQLNIVAQPDENGVVLRFVSQIIDLGPIKKLNAAELVLRELVELSSDAIYVVDPKYGQFLNCNRHGHERLGYSKHALLKLRVSDIHPKFKDEAKWREHVHSVKMNGSRVFESSHQALDGSFIPVEASLSFATVSGENYLLAIVRDISERKAHEKAFIDELRRDPLTKLPNRAVLNDKLEQIIFDAKQDDSFLIAVYVDIDNFKQINDSYGHVIGDGVLVTTAKRLGNCIRRSDIVTRLGGDEFLIVLTDIASLEIVAGITEKLVSEFKQPFNISGTLVEVSVSMGVVKLDKEHDNAIKLIDAADRAMYRAKAKVGTHIEYVNC